MGLRQRDLSAQSGVSQQVISDMDLGRLDERPLGKIRAAFKPMNASVELLVRWRGGDLDRLADERHATIASATARLLEAAGWELVPEVTYSAYGERGAIDILAWHASTRTLLVVEIKSELTSVEETLRKHDEKARLAARIARERFGWEPRAVGRLLVLPAESTARRRIARHEEIFSRAYPVRGDSVRWWLRNPVGPFRRAPFRVTHRWGRW